MGRSGELETSAQDAAVVQQQDRSGVAVGAERRRILDAMVDTVAERGYADTEIEDVIERAGVSRPAFARLFSSKEECFVETISDAVRSLVRTVEAAAPSEASWPERVRLGLAAFVGALVTDPARTRIAMVEAESAGPAATREVRRAYERFVPYFDEGRKVVSYELPGPTSDAVVGGIALTVQRQVADGDIQGLWNVLPDLVYFALVPYLGHRRASALSAD